MGRKGDLGEDMGVASGQVDKEGGKKWVFGKEGKFIRPVK